MFYFEENGILYGDNNFLLRAADCYKIRVPTREGPHTRVMKLIDEI